MADALAPADRAPVGAALPDAAVRAACSGNLRRDAAASCPPVVLDTNCVLDAWLFADPRVAEVARLIRAGSAYWIATPAMRSELARVLAYPAIARQLQARGVLAEDVLAAFDRWAHPVAPACVCPLRCTDHDDQMFVDLAVQWHADLYSRDRAVRALARRLQPAGVRVRPAGADVPSGLRLG